MRIWELSLHAAASSQGGGEVTLPEVVTGIGGTAEDIAEKCQPRWQVCSKGTHTLSPHMKGGFPIEFTDG